MSFTAARSLLVAALACTSLSLSCASAPKATAAAASSSGTADAPVMPALKCPAVAAMAPADVDALLDQVLAGPQRSEANRARDTYRHPKQTLDFMGLKPNLTVVELWPGGGWYTEVLGPFLKDCGALISAQPGAAEKLKAKMAAAPAVYGGARVQTVDPPKDITLAPDGSVDMVLTFRNVHNWVAAGYEADIYKAAWRALKPGGTFGVVEHRAPPGTDEATSAKTGYVDEAAVIARITAAGFVLDEKSEINANPKDTKDYAKGVWTLPPSLQLGDVDKAKYLAIGESDRMTLRFKKPAAPAK